MPSESIHCPTNWCNAALSDLLPMQYGKSLTASKRVESGYFDVYGSSGKVGRHAKALTKKPTLIVGRKGNVGSVFYSASPCWPIDTVYYSEGTDSTDLEFFRYLLEYLPLKNLDRSTAIPGLSRDDFHIQQILLPPLPEQHRIVEAIESYLTRLDDAAESLERVQRNLKRYRASVLKAAVEGRLVLTEADLAQAEGREYEPAAVLLERILEERKKRWIEETAEKARAKAEEKARKAGKKWTKADNEETIKAERLKAAKKYKPPVEPDTEGLPVLPEGWCWASVEQLGDVSGGITLNAKRKSLPNQVPYLRVANVYSDELRLDEIKYIGISDSEIDKAKIIKNDILVVEGNGSPDQIGRMAIWDDSIENCRHQNHLIRIRLFDCQLARWCVNWFLSLRGHEMIAGVASSTSGLYTLNISKIGSLSVPVAPIAEIKRITQLCENEKIVTRRTLNELSINEKRISRLRQSILKWAFEGKLVDQDPNDEPASVLLERIRAERQAQQSASKPTHRKKSAKKNTSK